MLSVNDIIMRYQSAEADRQLFDPVWEEILALYMPRRLGVHDTSSSQGKDKSKKIYDGTPGSSLLRLAAVINSTLTNQAMNWFVLETDDPEINEIQEVKEDWLGHDRDVVRKSLENSNFYQQINEFYQDLCGPATGTIYCEESKAEGKDLYFATQHPRGVYPVEDDQGNLTTQYVVREMSAWQIMEKWRHARITGKIPDKVRQAMDSNKPNSKFKILHAVFPNDDYQEGNELNPLKFRFASVWIHVDDKTEIHRSGYHEMAYITEFWQKSSGEMCGRGPAWDALADVKSLYSMKRSTLTVGQKSYDPPIMMPDSTTTYPVQLRPGGVTYFDPTSRHAPFALTLGQGFPIGRDMIQDERDQVRDHFYITQLHLIDSREMTAEEVRARMSENAKILGPTFGRLNSFLERLFERVLGILGRKGKLAPVPDVVKQAIRERGIQLKVRFVSPIVKAATLSEVQGITHAAATAIGWATEGGQQQVLDVFDWDYGARKVAELDGAPPEFLRSDKDVKEIREARNKTQQMMQRLEELEKRAGIAKQDAEAQQTYIANKQQEMTHGLTA